MVRWFVYFQFKVKVQTRHQFCGSGIPIYFLVHVTKEIAKLGNQPNICVEM